MKDLVAFDRIVATPDGLGGEDRDWQEIFQCAAELRYDRGSEAERSGGLTGKAVFKVRVRATPQTEGLTTADRMRDVGRGVAYNLREVDAVTDRAFVWLKAESGVAI